MDWVDEREKNELVEQEKIAYYSPEEILRKKNFDHLQKEELEKVKSKRISVLPFQKDGNESVKKMEEGKER